MEITRIKKERQIYIEKESHEEGEKEREGYWITNRLQADISTPIGIVCSLE